VAGAAISPTTTATVNGSVTINGNPSTLVTPVAGDSNTYFNYGNTNYQLLAAGANLTYPAARCSRTSGPSRPPACARPA